MLVIDHVGGTLVCLFQLAIAALGAQFAVSVSRQQLAYRNVMRAKVDGRVRAGVGVGNVEEEGPAKARLVAR